MSQRPECSCYENGKCFKYREAQKCNPTTIDRFVVRLEPCEMNEVCENGSLWGNFYFFITDEDIEALKAGKVLYMVDEYGTFIAYAPKEAPND